MHRWLMPIVLLLASLSGWAALSRGGGSRDETTYQLDVALLQAAPPGSPAAGPLKRLTESTVHAAEGREAVYRSGGEVVLDGEAVPLGHTLRAVLRREGEGRVHLKFVLENSVLAGRAKDWVLLETHQARYSGAIELGERIQLTFGEFSGRRTWVELVAQEVDQRAE